MSPTENPFGARSQGSSGPWPHLTLADPVVVLKSDTPVVLHKRPPRITAMGWPLPGQQRSLELPIGLGDDDRLRDAQDLATHGCQHSRLATRRPT